jgi:hypothetical protein
MKFFTAKLKSLWTFCIILNLLSKNVIPQFNINDTSLELMDYKDHKLDPVQIAEDEISAEREDISVDEESKKYYYKIIYTPNEDHYFVKKAPHNTNTSALQLNDFIFFAKQGIPIYLGFSQEMGLEFDTNQVMDIVEADADITKNDEAITSLHLNTLTDMKREMVDIDAAYSSHQRVLDVIKYEINENGDFLNVDKDEFNLEDFKTMTSMYLDLLVDILKNTTATQYDKIITQLTDGSLTGTGEGKALDQGNGFTNFFVSSEESKFKKSIDKLIDEFCEDVKKNIFFMTTIRKYYESDIRDFVNNNNLLEAFSNSISSQSSNMLIGSLFQYMKDGKHRGQNWSLDKPGEKKEENTLYIQDEMIEHLSQIIYNSIGSLIDASLEVDEFGNIIKKTLEEKEADNATPVERFDLHLYHMIETLNENFYELAHAHWEELTMEHLAFINESFIEQANFNAFVIRMLLNNTKDEIEKFIEQYTETTIKRTFIPEIFLGVSAGNINFKVFYHSMCFFINCPPKEDPKERSIQFIHRGDPPSNKSENSVSSNSSSRSNDQNKYMDIELSNSSNTSDNHSEHSVGQSNNSAVQSNSTHSSNSKSSHSTSKNSSHNTSGNSSHNTSRNSSHNTSGNSSHNSSKHSSHNTSKHSSHNTSRNSSHNTSRNSSHNTSRNSSHNTSRNSSHNTSRNSSHNTSRNSSHNTSRNSSHNTSRNSSHNSSKHSSHNTSRNSSHNTSRNSSHNTSSNRSNEPTHRSSEISRDSDNDNSNNSSHSKKSKKIQKDNSSHTSSNSSRSNQGLTSQEERNKLLDKDGDMSPVSNETNSSRSSSSNSEKTKKKIDRDSLNRRKAILMA